MTSSVAAPALSDVLFACAGCLRDVLAGRSLTESLQEVPDEWRAPVQSVSFYVMRQLATGQALSELLLDKKAPNRLVESLLVVALCLLAVDENQERNKVRHVPVYDAHTVVNQAVKAAEKHKKTASFKGLVNACLRNFLRNKASLMQAIAVRSEVKWGFPKWWIRQVRQAYPEQWQGILASAATPGPMTLRVNTRQISREELHRLFSEHGIEAHETGHAGLVLAQAQPVTQIPGFEQGWWSVQDAGAQLAGEIVPVHHGMRVLDACAAPGGKTAHMLELADLDMTVLDVDSRRLARVEENLARLKLDGPHVHMRAADAADLSQWWDGVPFDLVLADVPCTASGIVRRHPDIKWLRQEADLAKTAALQRTIVQALWQTVAPGGYLLYVTCSLFPIEGQEQARYLEMSLPHAERLGAPGQILPLAEQAGSVAPHDGFYYSLFRKKPVAGKDGKEI
ncbi:MAG: 16S rRNA (cytosine(967)-C(5))-methyltransferase RsmB [Alcaligenaceae bacterium]|nr:16S rRNA (cytosine(967)-C(5))-methyltransferase RsmB [Alcaligenaceae bacterium]